MSQQQDRYNSDAQRKGNTSLSDEQLMAYMEGKLSAEEQRIVEELMSDAGAEADAIEGLQMMHPVESKRMVAELQRKLHTELLRNNPKRKNKFAEDYWGWIAVVIILLLMIVGYIVVRIASK